MEHCAWAILYFMWVSLVIPPTWNTQTLNNHFMT